MRRQRPAQFSKDCVGFAISDIRESLCIPIDPKALGGEGAPVHGKPAMTKRGGILARFLLRWFMSFDKSPGCAGCGTVRALLRPRRHRHSPRSPCLSGANRPCWKVSNAPRGEHYALTTPGMDCPSPSSSGATPPIPLGRQRYVVTPAVEVSGVKRSNFVERKEQTDQLNCSRTGISDRATHDDRLWESSSHWPCSCPQHPHPQRS